MVRRFYVAGKGRDWQSRCSDPTICRGDRDHLNGCVEDAIPRNMVALSLGYSDSWDRKAALMTLSRVHHCNLNLLLYVCDKMNDGTLLLLVTD